MSQDSELYRFWFWVVAMPAHAGMQAAQKGVPGVRRTLESSVGCETAKHTSAKLMGDDLTTSVPSFFSELHCLDEGLGCCDKNPANEQTIEDALIESWAGETKRLRSVILVWQIKWQSQAPYLLVALILHVIVTEVGVYGMHAQRRNRFLTMLAANKTVLATNN
ncbi:MAG: hypothetical protein FRX49_02794 [Trebouxia sp. A1-2]|nr:MAG: hypothetical protein FRX49_02794 [Trebouxia sp. A1-2]